VSSTAAGSKWTPVGLLWGVALLNYLDRQVVFSQFSLIQKDLHATSLQLGLISSVFLWIYGSLSPFAGYIADRWGRARIILVGLFIWSGATWITAHVASINGMLFSRALMGVSEAFYLPAALALIVDRHGPSTRSLATGIHQSGLYAGSILGGAWGGWMGEHYGWRPTFTLLGLVGVIYGVVLVFTLRRDRSNASTRGVFRTLIAVTKSKGFVFLAAAFGVISVSNWLIYTWLPLFLLERFGWSLTKAGFTATFYMQNASFAGMLLSGILADRLALRNPRARVWIQMLGMTLTAPFLLGLSFTKSGNVVIAMLLGIGLLRPWFDVNAMPVLRQLVPSELCGTGYGLLNMIGCLAGGISAATAGGIKDTLGLAAAFECAAAVLIIGAAFLVFVRGQEPTEPATDG
jgi:predicted MFS family arabinose efflux permease